MKLQTTLLGKTYVFRDLKQVLAKANEEKTGDKLARLAAETAQERVAAKVVLAGVTLEELRENPAVPYEADEVTRLIQDDLNEPQYQRIKGWTVSDLREWILDEGTTGADIRRLSRGLTSEMVAAVCKLMGNLDLIYAANKIRVTAHCNTTIGLPGTLSCRLQPNHTTDDPEGITRDGLLAMMKEEDFDAVLNTNLKGAFNMIRHMTGLFIRAREGAIVNITSVAGMMGNAGQCNYSASKAGLIGLTKSVAKELAPKGIRCNAVAPGFIATDMTGNQTDNPLLDRIPLGKMGEADDVADAVAYLVTAKYVTGEVLRVDGGIAM